MINFFKSPAEGSGSAASGGSPQVTGGGEGSSATSGSTGTAHVPGQDKTKEQLEQENRFITKESLKGILDAKERFQTELLAKNNAELKTQLESLSKSIEEVTKSQSQHKADSTGDKADNPELVELRRKVKDLEESNQKVRRAHEEAQRRERDYRFETIVRDALLRQRCTKPDKVFRMIAPDLKFAEDGSRVYTTVKSDFGVEELEVGDYIRRVTMTELPQLFEASPRAGSPAGGDAGKADSQFLFTGSQIKNAQFYRENAEKIRAALEAKKVDFSK